MARILPGFVWPTAQDIDPLLARSRSPSGWGAQRPYWRPGTGFGYHALVMAALSGEVVVRAAGRAIQEHFAERIRDACKSDFYLGLPEDQESRFLSAQPALMTPERLPALAASATAPDSLTGIAFSRNHPDSREMWTLPNHRAVRAAGTLSWGGVASARGLAHIYAGRAKVFPLQAPVPMEYL